MPPGRSPPSSGGGCGPPGPPLLDDYSSGMPNGLQPCPLREAPVSGRPVAPTGSRPVSSSYSKILHPTSFIYVLHLLFFYVLGLRYAHCGYRERTQRPRPAK